MLRTRILLIALFTGHDLKPTFKELAEVFPVQQSQIITVKSVI
jgi:hypothetical protein